MRKAMITEAEERKGFTIKGVILEKDRMEGRIKVREGGCV